MRTLRILLAVCVLLPSGLLAQTHSRTVAWYLPMSDSLRRETACPAVDEWPPLPRDLHQLFANSPEEATSSGEEVEVIPGRGETMDVAVPQYAYYYNVLTRACEPVIVVQAEGGSLGWISLDGNRSGGAVESMFVLLGAHPGKVPPPH